MDSCDVDILERLRARDDTIRFIKVFASVDHGEGGREKTKVPRVP